MRTKHDQQLRLQLSRLGLYGVRLVGVPLVKGVKGNLEALERVREMTFGKIAPKPSHRPNRTNRHPPGAAWCLR